MAEDLTRKAANVCIYWESAEDSDFKELFEELDFPGRCTANTYFSEEHITCFNAVNSEGETPEEGDSNTYGMCDGEGKCRNCRTYDVGGMQYSHKDTTHLYTANFLYEWNTQQEKYLPVRQLTPDESRADALESLRNYIPYYQKIGTLNISGIQGPMNLAIYTLRAKFKKCCNWKGSPFMYSMNEGGTLLASAYGEDQVYQVSYLAQDANGRYTAAEALARSCIISEALPWKLPFTEENPTAYGCNGCKPECPYYTGPNWTYCVDDKMDFGDSISAAQIMEMRYYSINWSKFADPKGEWYKRFKDPEIFAWTGKWKFGDDEPEPRDYGFGMVEDAPTVRIVRIEDFTTTEPNIIIGEPIPIDHGTVKFYYGDIPEITTNFPTLIKELYDTGNELSIVWPVNTSSDSPFMFRTWRIGQNVIRLYVESPYITTLYAVNVTTYPQGSMSDSAFIAYMVKNHTDDIATYTAITAISSPTLPAFDVDLEYNQGINQIKVFGRDPTSITGEYLTDVCFVEHQMYHAMIIQTLGEDNGGNQRIQPWVERFNRAHCEADILKLANNPQLAGVYWNTQAGGRLTMYPTEEYYNYEQQTDWTPVGCDMIAVTFSNPKCSAVIPWATFGTGAHNEELGMWVDRSSHPTASSDGKSGKVTLQLVFWSGDGSKAPGNVVFARPASGSTWSAAFDPNYDRVYASYVVTEYNEGPIASEHKLYLKYPAYENYYITEKPVSHDIAPDGSFYCDGTFLAIQNISGDVDRIYDIEETQRYIYDRLSEEESNSVVSFQAGGIGDDALATAAEIFQDAQNEFDERYSGWFYQRDGLQVTLTETCNRLQTLAQHEGDYTFMFVFNDETGRPIGIKTASMLLQSATVETRDVEIYYEWEMMLLAWPIIDTLLLLAAYNQPAAPAEGGPEGTEKYKPKCGDHSELLLQSHIFGDPGPMWYPYESCLTPRYHEDNWSMAVKCENYVEGFGAGYDGKRWDYWERMRGNDIFSTWVYGPVFLVGCFYREISSSYQLTDEQTFTGYTRLRSCHPHGAFAKDREAVRISRHFLKRNLKVREEVVADADDDNTVKWTDDYRQIVFTVDETTGDEFQVAVGSEQETPIWVHLIDGVSRVNRTTPNRQHPFAHYLLKSVGEYDFSETFSDSIHNRLKLSEVLEDRDLTSIQNRRADGTLVYEPGEPYFFSDAESYDDIIPVYKDNNIAWGWLERPKDIERSDNEETRITGINLYNPTVAVWGTDRESAVYSEEGNHTLLYTPPIFNENSGLVETHPTLTLDGGPSKILNWYTGVWLDAGTTYDSSEYEAGKTPVFFGRRCSASGVEGFLMDNSGLHPYIHDITNDGLVTRWSARGFGVDCAIAQEELPHVISDMFNDHDDWPAAIDRVNTRLSTVSSHDLEMGMGGTYYVEEIHITYLYGPDEIEEQYEIRYDIPTVDIFVSGRLVDSWVASGTYQRGVVDDINTVEVVGAEGESYEGLKQAIQKKITYNVGTWVDTLTLRFGRLRADARAFIFKFEVLYRKPEFREEVFTNYEQRVNVSYGNTGAPDYRHMLYYYSRILAEYGDGLSYSLLESSSGLPSTKFTTRSVKDVILEYEYFDHTNTRFPYSFKTHPQTSPLVATDSEGIYSVPDAINICTKSRTLIAGSHKEDAGQIVQRGGENVINKQDVPSGETSGCVSSVGDRKLDETAQECLYTEARALAGGDPVTIFDWFWHPDETEFWRGTIGAYLPSGYQLRLVSRIPEFYKLYEHEFFGCTSDMSVPFYDGHLHPINRWRALGHRLRVGRPQFNWACFDVVVHKIEEHLGEDLYGTSEYATNVANPTWPYVTYRDRDFYRNAGIIENGANYIGGAVGGAGIDFWVQQSQFSHGELAVQKLTEWETTEAVYGGRNDATRADAARRGFHDDVDNASDGWRYWEE